MSEELQRLFHRKQKWLQDEWALDNQGKRVNPTSLYACSWCLGAGIVKITHGSDDPQCLGDYQAAVIEKIHNIIKEEFPERYQGPYLCLKPKFGQFNSIALFNDHPDTTFDDIRLIIETAEL